VAPARSTCKQLFLLGRQFAGGPCFSLEKCNRQMNMQEVTCNGKTKDGWIASPEFL
jgi:hypothetical protein